MQSVLTILNAIERGETTPRAAVAQSLDAIAAKDAAIGAFVALPERDEALAAADRGCGTARRHRRRRQGHHRHRTTCRPATARRSMPATARQATRRIVSLLRARGAMVAGKTVATEFAFLQPAATVNPHDPDHTPGGSSSGSAAAVAAGMVPVAIGTQTGGSVIRPAAYCGVAGYKPSFRLIPTGRGKDLLLVARHGGLLRRDVPPTPPPSSRG